VRSPKHNINTVKEHIGGTDSCTCLDAVLNLAKARGENRGDEGLAHPAKSLGNISCDTTNLDGRNSTHIPFY